MDNEKLAGLRDKLTTYAKNLGGRRKEIAGLMEDSINSIDFAHGIHANHGNIPAVKRYLKQGYTAKSQAAKLQNDVDVTRLGTIGVLAAGGLAAYEANMNKEAGLRLDKIKGAFGTFKKNLGGRKEELLTARTNKVISESMLDRLAPKETIAAGELSKMKLRPDMYSKAEIASAEGGLGSIKDSIRHYTAESNKFKGEVHDIQNSVLKARVGAGVAGGAALTGVGYTAKKFYDNSVQTDLSDSEKTAYFNPAPWADDVMNSYTQVKLVWEQKKREAARKKQNN